MISRWYVVQTPKLQVNEIVDETRIKIQKSIFVSLHYKYESLTQEIAYDGQ